MSDEDWRAEWRRQDALDRERNMHILEGAEANPDAHRQWLGFMGFAKEEEARLNRKLHCLRLEEMLDQPQNTE